MIKRFFNWIKGIELYQIFGVIFIALFAFFAFIIIPLFVHKETITHYDLIFTYSNGDTETIHCDYYGKKRDCIYYYVGDEIYYVNTVLVSKYYIVPVECDCDKV